MRGTLCVLQAVVLVALRILQADVQFVWHFVFCRLMYKCAALRILQVNVQFVGHFVFCRLMYNLCSTSCAAGRCTICAALCVLQTDVQLVRHFVFCRLMYKLCDTSVCFDHYYCLMEITSVCICF